MTDTQSLPSKIYSLLPTNVASNCAIFIGSGILVSSYSTTWLNDPTTQSGIVLAGLFNAIALGITNYITKTDENTSYVFQTVLTVVTLAATILTAPYLAAALTEKYAVVLTTDVAFQNGVLYLGIKAVLSLLYIGGSKIFAKEPLTLVKINNLSNEQLEAEYKYFNTKGNEKDWSGLSEEVQQAFIQAIISKLEQVKTMPFPTESDKVKPVSEYNKFQASLLHALLVSRGPHVLDPIMAACYAQLFFSHDLKPLDQVPLIPNGHNILPKNFKILDLNEVKNLTRCQVEWYQLFIFVGNVWELFPLDVQNGYNIKCQEHGMRPWFLRPKDEQSVADACDLTILILDSQLKKTGGVVLSEGIKNLVKDRSLKIFGALPVVQSKKDVESLSIDDVEKYHCSYSLYPIPPGVEIQMAFSERFITQKLSPPTNDWLCKGEIPAQDAFAKLDKFQLRWLAQFFAMSKDSWDSLDFRSQVTYNNRFLNEINKWFTVTAKADVEVIKEEGAISNKLVLAMKEWYESNVGSQLLEREAQDAFKALFAKAQAAPK